MIRTAAIPIGLLARGMIMTFILWNPVFASSNQPGVRQLVANGEPKSLYNTLDQSCGTDFIPDSPLRAFKDAGGQVVAFATHRNNWFMSGSNLLSVHSSCRTALSPDNKVFPSAGYIWVQAMYTPDGDRVVALVSDDHTLQVVGSGCKREHPGDCWLNEIDSIERDHHDGQFAVSPRGFTVAKLADAYPTGSSGRTGFFTTSNIANEAQYFYFMGYFVDNVTKKSGNCLFRTEDPFDPKGWRAWDGLAFTTSYVSGAVKAGADCLSVGQGSLLSEVRSLVYLSASRRWAAVFIGRARLAGDTKPIPGIYMSQSKDLINWESPTRMITLNLRPVDGGQDIVGYPSLIDPSSRSRNFDTIDSPDPVLTYTVIHPEKTPGVYNRQIMYVPLHFIQ